MSEEINGHPERDISINNLSQYAKRNTICKMRSTLHENNIADHNWQVNSHITTRVKTYQQILSIIKMYFNCIYENAITLLRRII